MKKIGFQRAAAMLWVCMLGVSTAYAEPVDKKDEISVQTIKTYFYADDHHQMDIRVPCLTDPRHREGARQVNKAVQELTKTLSEVFYRELETVGDGGYGATYGEYEVLMNRENWFTLKYGVSTVAGSSNRYYKIYNIDRNIGEVVTFPQLFSTAAFAEPIKQAIVRQMEERSRQDSSQVYFTEAGAWEITDRQNFYFNGSGQLVIVFDKYEVAPGSMGTPEFTLGEEPIRRLLKPQYQDITG